jgi:hypothetical protein
MKDENELSFNFQNPSPQGPRSSTKIKIHKKIKNKKTNKLFIQVPKP